jgi:molecular chaperone GrpE
MDANRHEHDDERAHEEVEAAPAADPAAELQAALREKEENHRNWQRALADYQNLRRRLQSDIDDAVRRGKQGLLADLLLVLDYLDMALSAPAPTPEAQSLRAGVELTRQQLWGALQREGLAAVDTQGAFDPARHDCVERVEDSGREEGAIVSVLRPGYVCNGVVLRPAQVRVASAGARAERG